MIDGFFGADEPRTKVSGLKIPKPVYHQLLVIGNGFDLECGLPSNYSDFCKPRFAAIDTQDWKTSGVLDGLGYKATPTVWDFLLKSKMYAPWYSVEDAINDLVLSAGDGTSDPTGLASMLIARIYDLAANGGDADCCDESVSCCTEENDPLSGAVEFIKADCGEAVCKADRPWTAQELIDYLGKQLKDFEVNFKNYLLSVSESNEDYIGRASELLRSMLEDGRSFDIKHEHATTILSFNYTNPFKRLLEQFDNINMINVHGSLQSGIIFGIDGTRCVDNPLAFPFSKTFRAITAGTDFGEGTVRTANNGLLNPETRAVKFYGHSLGEADYAYFQAIFDGVNLYASDTKLVFYYRPIAQDDGRREPERRARNTMAGNATRLLTEYGRTLDNEDHGRNLMHKLMIEGRLKVCLLK